MEAGAPGVWRLGHKSVEAGGTQHLHWQMGRWWRWVGARVFAARRRCRACTPWAAHRACPHGWRPGARWLHLPPGPVRRPPPQSAELRWTARAVPPPPTAPSLPQQGSWRCPALRPPFPASSGARPRRGAVPGLRGLVGPSGAVSGARVCCVIAHEASGVESKQSSRPGCGGGCLLARRSRQHAP